MGYQTYFSGEFTIDPPLKAEHKDFLEAFAHLSLPAATSNWSEVLGEVKGVSQYDVANAVTHFAQSRNTDRRLELEEAAAQYLYRRAS
jgi:hypothetical protein